MSGPDPDCDATPPARVLRVLVTEDAPGAGAVAARQLAEAGHDVVSCHEFERTGLCVGLTSFEGCPMDATPLDLVLAVRDSEPDLTASEFGLLCALRRRVPVAVVGDAPVMPLRGMGVHIRGENVAEACTALADGRLHQHEAAARRALWAMPQLVTVPADHVTVTVHRYRTRLVVDVQVPPEAATQWRSHIADRTLDAIRRHDREALTIDVTVSPTIESALIPQALTQSTRDTGP